MFLSPAALLLAVAMPPRPPPSGEHASVPSPVQVDAEGPLAGSAAAPAGTARAANPRPATDLITLLDYFDAGQRLALDYVDRLGAATRRQLRLASLSSACVRVSCAENGGRSVTFSTGVLVQGGRRVVTAGHGVGPSDDPGVLSVILADGRSIHATLASRSGDDQDWAILDLVGEVPATLASVPVGSATPGSIAFILGYPERVGLAKDGHATASLATRPEPLDPLLFVARVPLSGDEELEPLAGAVPLSGASGSPVFDEHGTLVAVLVAVGRLGYPEGVKNVYRVSLSKDFLAALDS